MFPLLEETAFAKCAPAQHNQPAEEWASIGVYILWLRGKVRLLLSRSLEEFGQMYAAIGPFEVCLHHCFKLGVSFVMPICVPVARLVGIG